VLLIAEESGMDGIGCNWMPISFGRLPAGAVFRVGEEDAGLFVKLAFNAAPTGNAVVIVSSKPGHPRYVQAGEITEFSIYTTVQALWWEEETP